MANQGLQINYVELGEREGTSSPEEACDLTTPSATRVLMVDWFDRKTAEWQILGTAWLGEGCTLKRWLPEQHPDKPWLWATRIRRSYGVRPQGVHTVGSGYGTAVGSGLRGADLADLVPGSVGSGLSNGSYRSINWYKYCVFEVEYTRPPYNILADDDVDSEVQRYVEYLPEFQGDYLSVPFDAGGKDVTAFKFVETGHTFNGNLGVIVPAEIERLKWWQVPEAAINELKIWELVGKVNDDTFSDGRYNYAEERLLFCGIERERIWLPHDGSPGWNITFLLKWFKHGHNHFYDFMKDGAFDPAWRIATLGGGPVVKSGAGHNTLYEYGDYDDLFSINEIPCGSGEGSEGSEDFDLDEGTAWNPDEGTGDSWNSWLAGGQYTTNGTSTLSAK